MAPKVALEQITANYYKALEIAAKNKSQKSLMKRQWVDMMLERILVAKEVVLNEGIDKLHPRVKEGYDSYNVIEMGMERKLVLKSEWPGSPKEIVPLEQTFSVVWKAHEATNHGGITAMVKWLTDLNIAVSEICLPALIKICDDCQELIKQMITKEPEKKNYKHVVFVNIVDMSQQESTDDRFDCMLILQHKNTKFLQLRPLSSADLIDTISNELTQLFSDLGPPECIVVKPALQDIFVNVLSKRLNLLFIPNIAIDTCDETSRKITFEVQAALTDWMKRMPEGKWCIGCFFVQWELNNATAEDGQSPIEKIFLEDKTCEVQNTEGSKTSIDAVKATVKAEPCDVIDDYIAGNPALEWNC